MRSDNPRTTTLSELEAATTDIVMASHSANWRRVVGRRQLAINDALRFHLDGPLRSPPLQTGPGNTQRL